MTQEARVRVQALQEPAHRPADITPLDRTEAAALATVESSRFLSLLRSLAPDEWRRSTICPGWTVRAVAAHVCGVVSIYAHWSAGLRQFGRSARQIGPGWLNAVNEAQIADRVERSPEDLIAELAADSPISIRTRHIIPGLLRRLPVPIPNLGPRPWGYALDDLYSREIWLHRLDICRALDRSPEATADHDGRIVELVVRDLGTVLPARFGDDLTVRLELTGPAGGFWVLGHAAEADAAVSLAALDFAWLSSGRTTVEELRRDDLLAVTGNAAVGLRALVLSSLPF